MNEWSWCCWWWLLHHFTARQQGKLRQRASSSNLGACLPELALLMFSRVFCTGKWMVNGRVQENEHLSSQKGDNTRLIFWQFCLNTRAQRKMLVICLLFPPSELGQLWIFGQTLSDDDDDDDEDDPEKIFSSEEEPSFMQRQTWIWIWFIIQSSL